MIALSILSMIVSLGAWFYAGCIERQFRDKLVSECARVRALAYVTGYNDGKLGYERGTK